MGDIHCHILPGVDDGAKDYDHSLELLNQEIENENKYVVLTPHQSQDNITKADLIKAFLEFKKNVDLDISLYLGAEVYYYDGLIEDLKKDRILTLNNTKYVLIEFSTRVDTPISDIVYEISLIGYVPIIAHIERYSYLKFEDICDIVKNGGLIQVNSSSFKNRLYKKLFKNLFKNHLVSFIASDCHDANKRPCDFKEAKKYIMKKYKDQYKRLFEDLPEFVSQKA